MNIFLMFVGCFCSVIFIVKYFSVDFESLFGAGFQVVAATSTFYTIIAALILRDDIMKIVIDIQMIYEMRTFVQYSTRQPYKTGVRNHFNFTYLSILLADKNKDSSKCLLEAGQYFEWLIQFTMKYFTIAFPVCQFLQILGSAIYSYIAYGYFNNDILYRPYKLA